VAAKEGLEMVATGEPLGKNSVKNNKNDPFKKLQHEITWF
jgi:hypothetical protein